MSATDKGTLEHVTLASQEPLLTEVGTGEAGRRRGELKSREREEDRKEERRMKIRDGRRRKK